MNNDIIIRLKYAEGQNRITVKPIDTFGEFMMKVRNILSLGIQSLQLYG